MSVAEPIAVYVPDDDRSEDVEFRQYDDRVEVWTRSLIYPDEFRPSATLRRVPA